ncbi:MAG: DUF1572 family protein [Planctomycetota bacterium]
MTAERKPSNLEVEFTTHQNHQLDAAMDKIEHCVAQLSQKQVWHRTMKTANSVANLLIHLAGNLRQWAIVPCNGLEDRRDRESEFAANESQTVEEMMALLRCTVAEAKASITACDEEILMCEHEIQGFKISLLGALTHTTSHFVGHTHQIIMLTRQILGDGYRFQWSPDSDRDKVPV